MDDFVHLHVHSNLSFMDGVSSPEALLEAAAGHGMSALAITDHQGLYGAIRSYRAAGRYGVKPIIGTEIVTEAAGADGCVPGAERMPPVGSARAAGAGFHLTLLAKDIAGYRSLCRLLSATHVRAARGPSVVRLEDLERLSEGVIGLSGCPCGEAGAAVLAGHTWRAGRVLERLARCFAPGDFYVELMHLMTPDSPRYVATLADLAGRLGLPVVATNDVHYTRASAFRLHDVLSAAGARHPLPGPYGRSNGELWLKPAAEMRNLFAHVPGACDATLEVAGRCDLDLGLGAFHFPAARVPAGETPRSTLARVARDGLERRYRPVTPEAVTRLRHELAVIEQLGFSEYFLVVKEIVDFARSRDIRCSGRGSAGDSIVTYLLGITDADPIAHELLFERFLNPERRQMPDIDVDFDSRRRDEVIAFIYERFGAEHVAMVATVNTMMARSAVRTAARALGHTPAEVDAFSRYLPWVSARRLPEVLATYPECRDHLLVRPEHRLIVELATELDGTPMHLGTHLGGFIITREPIDIWMPLQWAAKGVVVSQYDKDDIEALGLVKMDILGLRTHSAVTDTVRMARERVERESLKEALTAGMSDAAARAAARAAAEKAVPEPFELSKDDPEVYRMIAAADTVGMFQLESSGQRNLALRLRERDFEDIIAAISLFRPGPLEAEMITPFIRRRHGLEPVSVSHEAMAGPLRSTYGVIIYQEQVLQVAREVAGFTLAEADSLRRAMTKGRSREEMARIRGHFIERACERGVAPEVAGEVFRQLEGFAAYGFCKAHAACFAVVSYATAWLKTYYPAEFAAAILNNEPMGFYSPRLVLNDARRHGIAVLTPHVNDSSAEFTVERSGGAIRVGLQDVHHMTSRLLEAMATERSVRPFRDLADFLRRTSAEERTAESLIRVGALDGLGVTDEGRPPTRDETLALLPELKVVIAREGVAGDDTLLIAPVRARKRVDTGHVSGWTPAMRVTAELELLGLSVTTHPLTLARADLERRGVVWASRLTALPDRTRVLVVGVRERAQTPRTRSGRRTCFLTLEDPSGLLDVVVFEDALARYGDVIVKHRAYLVTGMLQNNPERGLAIIAERIEPYRVRADGGTQVRLRRGVGLGSMGPSRPGVGAPEDEDAAGADAACG